MFEVSGSAAGVELMTELACIRGRVVVVAIFPEPPPVRLFDVFWKELTIGMPPVSWTSTPPTRGQISGQADDRVDSGVGAAVPRAIPCCAAFGPRLPVSPLRPVWCSIGKERSRVDHRNRPAGHPPAEPTMRGSTRLKHPRRTRRPCTRRPRAAGTRGPVYRTTRAAPPRITRSTSASVDMEVSPGVVIASAPCATPYASDDSGSAPLRRP